jgi:putative transposase
VSVFVERAGFRPATDQVERSGFSPGDSLMKLAPQEVRTFFLTIVTWQRRSIFLSEPLIALLLETIACYQSQGKFQIHEFVIMPNHLHLLITPDFETSLEKAVQLIKGGFSFRVKKETRSNLEIWQASFTEHRVRDYEDYEKHVTYIRENPVRAGLALRAQDYLYGTTGERLQTFPRPPWLKPLVGCDRSQG